MAEVSEDLGEAMTGINMDDLAVRWAAREGGNMVAEECRCAPMAFLCVIGVVWAGPGPLV